MKGPQRDFIRKTEAELRAAYVDLNRKAKVAGLSPEDVLNLRLAMLEAKRESGLKGLNFTIIANIASMIVGVEEVLDDIEKFGLEK